jgi:hypothetical protein
VKPGPRLRDRERRSPPRTSGVPPDRRADGGLKATASEAKKPVVSRPRWRRRRWRRAGQRRRRTRRPRCGIWSLTGSQVPVAAMGWLRPAGSGMVVSSPFRRRGGAGAQRRRHSAAGRVDGVPHRVGAVVGHLDRLVQALLGGLVVPRVAGHLGEQLGQDSWMSSRSSASSDDRVRMPGRTALSAIDRRQAVVVQLDAEAGADGSTTTRSGVTPTQRGAGDRHGGQPLAELAGVLGVGELPALSARSPSATPG